MTRITTHRLQHDLVADTETAQKTARHVRISVESLLDFVADGSDPGTDTAIPAASESVEYYLAVYEALLETNLEALFGLPRLTESRETGQVRWNPLRTIEALFLRLWRREYLHEGGTTTDHFEDPYPRWIRDDSPHNATIDADGVRA